MSTAKKLVLLILAAMVVASVACGSTDEEKCNQAKKEYMETLSGDSQEKMERAYYKAEEVCLEPEFHRPREGNTK